MSEQEQARLYGDVEFVAYAVRQLGASADDEHAPLASEAQNKLTTMASVVAQIKVASPNQE